MESQEMALFNDQLVKTAQAEKSKSSAIASEFEKKGEKIAAESKFKYQLKSTKDEISKKEVLTAVTQIKVGAGSVIAEIFCRSKYIDVDFTFDKATPPATYRAANKGYFTEIRNRVNEQPSSYLLRRSDEFNNVYNYYIGPVADGNIIKLNETKEVIYDLALQFKTNLGDAYIEIPPYDKSIRKVVAACK